MNWKYKFSKEHRIYAHKIYINLSFKTLWKDWKEAYKVADEYRFPNESRAVVMDNKCVFINASAGCRYIEINPKQCDKVYKSAEGKIGKFMGHKWKYASKDVIQNIIDKMEEGEEKDNDIK